MFKGFEYNQEYRRIKSKSVYAQEIEILHEFAASDKDNVRLEYTTEQEAVNARQALYNYIKEARKPLKVMQRGKYVFAVKTNECE